MTKRRILQALLVLLAIGSIGVAGLLFLRSWRAQKIARFVKNYQGGYSAAESFVATGTLAADSSGTLKSPLSQAECLAYRIKYDFAYTTTDSDGEPVDRREELLDDRQQVEGLKIVFQDGEAQLDLASVKTFYEQRLIELESLPEDVPTESLPDPPPRNFWFEAYENVFTPGQKLTIVGQVGELKNLVAPAGFDELVVFPGDKTATVNALKAASKKDYIFGFALLVLGLVVILVFGLILKYADLGD